MIHFLAASHGSQHASPLGWVLVGIVAGGLILFGWKPWRRRSVPVSKSPAASAARVTGRAASKAATKLSSNGKAVQPDDAA